MSAQPWTLTLHPLNYFHQVILFLSCYSDRHFIIQCHQEEFYNTSKIDAPLIFSGREVSRTDLLLKFDYTVAECQQIQEKIFMTYTQISHPAKLNWIARLEGNHEDIRKLETLISGYLIKLDHQIKTAPKENILLDICRYIPALFHLLASFPFNDYLNVRNFYLSYINTPQSLAALKVIQGYKHERRRKLGGLEEAKKQKMELITNSSYAKFYSSITKDKV